MDADAKETWRRLIPKDIEDRYEVHDFRHAAIILSQEYPAEFKEICTALREFQFTDREVRMPGGNESVIPKRFSAILRDARRWGTPWVERQLTSKQVYTDPKTGEEKERASDTHKVDYCKGKIALDLEWNSKDQTSDRDLFAFRAYHDLGLISVGVIITRSNELDPYFIRLGNALDKDGKEADKLVKAKFGASTTHLGKLLPRINAGRGGSCPLLVMGITPRCRSDA